MSLLASVRARAKAAAFDVLCAAGFGAPILRDRPGERVLVWHGLDLRGGSGFNARFVSAAAFEGHVVEMQERFHIVPLGALFEGVRHATKLTVALTFDDGYESFATLALPILERHGVPAALFVTAIRAAGEEVLWPDLLDVSAHLTDAPLVVAGERFVKDRRRRWRSERDGTPLKERGRRGDGAFVAELSAALRRVAHVPSREDLALYWRTLSEEQLRAVAASPLVTVGSHGTRHLSLAHLPREEAREEMAVSKTWLEGVIGRPVEALAFPDGSFREETLADAEALGFRRLLAAEPFPRVPRPTLRGRLTINPFASPANRLRGIYAGRWD